MFNISITTTEDGLCAFNQFMGTIHDKIRNSTIIPGPVHMYLSDMRKQGRLMRVYTQNFDGLEAKAGLSVLNLEPPPPSPGTPMVNNGVLVQLHGNLSTVRCTHCGHVSQWTREHSTAFADRSKVWCVQCKTDEEKRVTQGKRTIVRNKEPLVRANVLLYDELPSHSGVIQSLVIDDLKEGPDLLLIMGTELRIPHLREVAKKLARKVHQKEDGHVLFINTSQVKRIVKNEGWIDTYLHMSCETWLDIFYDRQPDVDVDADAECGDSDSDGTPLTTAQMTDFLAKSRRLHWGLQQRRRMRLDCESMRKDNDIRYSDFLHGFDD